MKRDTALIRLDQIRMSHYVRVGLNEEHVAQLTQLYESGADLPPLLLDKKTLELIDGRHRKAALERLGRIAVNCERVTTKDPSHLVMMALAANVGGALPPTQADINHAISLLLDQGVSRAQIIRRLSPLANLPAAFVRKHVSMVQSERAKVRLNRAVTAVVDDGLSVKDAAVQHEVELSTLRSKLRGGRVHPVSGLDEIKAGLTTSARSWSQKNSKQARKVIDEYKDGVRSEESAREVLTHIRHLNRQAARSHIAWMRRFEAVVKQQSGDVKPIVKAKKGASSKPKQPKPEPKTKPEPKKSTKANGTSTLKRMGLS